MSTITTPRRSLRRVLGHAGWFARETWIGYGMVLPALVLTLVIIVYPTLRAIWISFNEQSFLHPEQTTWVGLANYTKLFGDHLFIVSLWHTVFLTVVGVVSMYLLGLGLALLLQEKLPGLGFLRSLSMVSWVIPPVVIAIAWEWMLQSNFGLVNLVLPMFGVPNKTWFGDIHLALPIVTMLRVWKDTPFVAIALLANMRAIPEEFYEAAEIDGANAYQRFRHVTLPNISYTSMIMIVVETIACFNSFQMIFITTGGGPVDATEVLGTYIYNQAFNQYALGYASAVGVVMMVILGAFTVIDIYLEGTE